MNYPLDPQILFSRLSPSAPILVAVSGGSDSVALLHLASTWARSADADLRIVTVDHGLRPEAAAEAAFVAGVCEALNWPHFTLAWEGLKPETGVSESARNARYGLLAEFALDCGAKTILTGHTLNDQAETVWMRNSRNIDGSGFRGLAGMAETMTLQDDLEVVRPLLPVSRDQLRSYLAGLGQTWIEDPSNFDQSYERVRVRRALAKSDMDIETLGRFAAICGRFRRIDCEAVSKLLISQCKIEDGLVLSLPVAVLHQQTSERALLALKVLIATAGGGKHFVSHDLATEILAMETGDRRTAGNCIIEHKGEFILVYRESRNLPFLSVEPGDIGVWDSRLLIDNQSSNMVICRAAEVGDLKYFQENSGWIANVKPKAACRSLPVVHDNFGNMMMPFTNVDASLKGVSWRLVCPALEHFRSRHDDRLAEFLNHVRLEIEPVRLH